jgi:hypothetical protein
MHIGWFLARRSRRLVYASEGNTHRRRKPFRLGGSRLESAPLGSRNGLALAR